MISYHTQRICWPPTLNGDFPIIRMLSKRAPSLNHVMTIATYQSKYLVLWHDVELNLFFNKFLFLSNRSNVIIDIKYTVAESTVLIRFIVTAIKCLHHVLYFISTTTNIQTLRCWLNKLRIDIQLYSNDESIFTEILNSILIFN